MKRGSPAVVVAIACAGAAVVTSGIQGIAPAIPAIQDVYALSDAQVALVTSIYLFPSIFSAFGAGLLADRFGGRPVFAGALLLYGATAVVLLLEHGLVTFFVIRFVQGAAFGAVLSLSVALIGTVAPTGPPAARAQSRRIITMAAAEAALPAVGGFLLALAWYAPFALQVLALPIGLLAWAALPAGAPVRKSTQGARLRAVVHTPAVASVQFLGASRFLFKFAVLTYFPLLAVNELGATPQTVGLVLGASALVSALAAALTERLAVRWSPAHLIGACLLVVAASLSLMGLADAVVVAAVGMFLYGLQDGVFGVAHNVLVTEVAPSGARSTYIGVTGTVRNIGKFAAPMLFGAVTLALSISQSFLVLAALGATSSLASRRVVRALDGRGEETPPEGAGGTP